ncbi:Haloacid dehalogenase superfamily, subfamily IA, variant 2 with 3rd motif like haloacid dehalogenase/haloacid dehalogenase superfamily, subfamily IA, variant 3 with third motif having DD or ED/haloacid dehalogenase superfamily, subfamily IA, variant 1 with third motif having Dx(3-4)D or Dx(3-4)E [Prauserella flava]|nr:Haloacid dehalogenase superfamily, subfamily IA, variant 2 with 3rd motif like haloacid dehalogenase/haloacid dehalogenase superfamily, subfamily IA, variant 3 with third motif having DD or ED/haloacid dehalogenase superfamily, subfamily IA, variant 1 with third motif having Dx(3-4)D or Dx(3-4)E [Prauserella flava]MCR3735099.1 Haloacid dehalogenase superfamily, subfamily IA, variant 2 with 3rd motif like haloacid dehalogenase/haloacid dehalogenase superfamily, subfamily IA, variant 3 with third
MFDFSGTLFRLEHRQSWFTGLVDDDGRPLDADEQAELMRRMTAPVTLTVDLDEQHREAWEHRDLDPELHHKAYLEILKQSGVPGTDQAEALYRRLIDPAEWTPYPDTASVLKELSGAGVKVGVLSNIAFDIRPAFTARGLDAYVDEFVLSYEVGYVKPDPAVFRILVERLGSPAESTLMVGDHTDADGGATGIGCEFALVEPLPTAERTDGLRAALREHGAL